MIVGAGDFGRELAAWLRNDELFLGSDDVCFIDDNSAKLNGFPKIASLYAGAINDYEPSADDRLLIGLSDPPQKRKVVKLLKQRGATFSTFVHRSAILTDDCNVGEGVIICPNSVVASGATLSDFTMLNIGVTVGHDAIVGAFSSLMSHVDVTGWVSIGEECMLGSHATVLPHVVVGARSIIGAGSAVIRKVNEDSTVIGVPAKAIRG